MSPEFGNPNVMNMGDIETKDPIVEVGKFFYSPESWIQGFKLIASIGNAFYGALGGTLTIARTTLGAERNSTGTAVITPQSTIPSVSQR